jgi:hypothetical protein
MRPNVMSCIACLTGDIIWSSHLLTAKCERVPTTYVSIHIHAALVAADEQT